MKLTHSVGTGAVLALAAALAPATGMGVAQAQATGTIEGRVIDRASGRALANAQVFVAGTQLGTQSTDAGTFRITAVPARQVEVRVRLIGYAPASRTVVVTGGQTARVEISLGSSALQLDQVVVTGTGQRTEVKRLGNTVAVVKPPENAPINSVSDVLQGREPGMVGLPSSGMSGEGARIRIRGNASLTQSNEPIVFIDGVRMNSGGGFGTDANSGGSSATGGGSTSRLDDLDPATIERVEVLKGAAAATLFGTEASNGVIQIFTKKGAQGAPKWRFQLQGDAMDYPTDRYKPNTGFASTATQAQGLSQFYGRTIQPFEIIETNNLDAIIRTGTAQLLQGSVDGGNSGVTYYLSGRYADENGPIAQLGSARNTNRLLAGTSNLTFLPTAKLKLGLRTSYAQRDFESVDNGNNIYGVNTSAYFARPELANCTASATGPGDNGIASPGTCRGPGNPFGNGGSFLTLREAFNRDNAQSVGRFTGAFDGAYTVSPELNFTTILGLDATSQRDVFFERFGWNVDRFSSLTPQGNRQTNDLVDRQITIDAKANWNPNLFTNVSTSVVAGFQGFISRLTTSGSINQNFPGPGIAVTPAGNSAQAAERYNETVNGGYFGQAQVGWKDWIFGTVGGRYDFASAFGADAGGVFYPKVSLSVVPTDLKSWGIEKISSWRLRAAWGQSGRQPGAFDQFTTFTALPSNEGSGLAPFNLGNRDLRPEISTEIEVGSDIGLFGNRVGIDATLWTRRVTDLLYAFPFAPSGGFFRTQLANVGEMSANGFELGVKYSAVQGRRFSLDLNANGAYLRQVLDTLRGAPERLRVNYFRSVGFLAQGQELGSYYVPQVARSCDARPAGATFRCLGAGQLPFDANRDGRPDTEADLLAYFAQPRNLRDAGVKNALAPLLEDAPGTSNGFEHRFRDGTMFPKWTGSFGGTATVFSNLRINTLFEWRTGFFIQNLTDQFRQDGPVFGGNIREASEIGATMENPASTPQQRLDAARRYLGVRSLLEPGLNGLSPGDFLRWRELAITYTLPTRLAKSARFSNASVTLTGRNLMLFTKYEGLDPEINWVGRSAGANIDSNFTESYDAFGFPLPRRYAIAFNFGF